MKRAESVRYVKEFSVKEIASREGWCNRVVESSISEKGSLNQLWLQNKKTGE